MQMITREHRCDIEDRQALVFKVLLSRFHS